VELTEHAGANLMIDVVSDRIDIPSKSESPKMFDRISGRYDLLNHLLSFGQDFIWRRKVASLIARFPHERLLDLACGTCDLLLAASGYNDNIKLCIGIDASDNMLRIGDRKIRSRGLSRTFNLIGGDGMELPLADGSVDFSMISFGIRNMPDPQRTLHELCRVTEDGGTLAVLEFSIPERQPVASIYMFYLRRVLPLLGGLISGDHRAYSYLNKTVETFAYGEKFCEMMRTSGFASVEMFPLTMGVATVYLGHKK
jgi:demethylmenaquinone methyltransferase/2-methoxy-6-polyprenyl-1,4-benzoquinol methylase